MSADAALASSFPDYSALQPLFIAMMVAACVGIMFAFVRWYRRPSLEERDERGRVPGIERRLLYVVLVWVFFCGMAALLLSAIS